MSLAYNDPSTNDSGDSNCDKNSLSLSKNVDIDVCIDVKTCRKVTSV